MYKNVYSYLDEITQKRREIDANVKAIKEQNQCFNRIIEGYNNKIFDLNCDIKNIKETAIRAEFSDIVKHIAEDWGVSVEDIVISYTTPMDYSTLNDYEAEATSRKFNEFKGSCPMVVPFSFIFSSKERHAKTGLQYQLFVANANVLDTQKDGKNLAEHIESKISKTDKSIDVKITIDDLNQFVLTCPLGYLIYDNHKETVAKTMSFEAVLAVAEDYRQKYLDFDAPVNN